MAAAGVEGWAAAGPLWSHSNVAAVSLAVVGSIIVLVAVVPVDDVDPPMKDVVGAAAFVVKCPLVVGNE